MSLIKVLTSSKITIEIEDDYLRKHDPIYRGSYTYIPYCLMKKCPCFEPAAIFEGKCSNYVEIPIVRDEKQIKQRL